MNKPLSLSLSLLPSGALRKCRFSNLRFHIFIFLFFFITGRYELAVTQFVVHSEQMAVTQLLRVMGQQTSMLKISW